MTPNIDTARAALRRGATLADAAQAGGFQFAADLDLALWAEMPGNPIAPVMTKDERARETIAKRARETMFREGHFKRMAERLSKRVRAKFDAHAMTDDEIAEAQWLNTTKGYRMAEAIGIIVGSRRPVQLAEPAR